MNIHVAPIESRSPETGPVTNSFVSGTVDPSIIRDQVVSMLYREVLDLRARVATAERQLPTTDVHVEEERRTPSPDSMSILAPPTYHEH